MLRYLAKNPEHIMKILQNAPNLHGFLCIGAKVKVIHVHVYTDILDLQTHNIVGSKPFTKTFVYRVVDLTALAELSGTIKRDQIQVRYQGKWSYFYLEQFF